MSGYITLFKDTFPRNRSSNDRCFAYLYDTLELDYYQESEWIIQISVRPLSIEFYWKPITKTYGVTKLRIKKLKELHEQLFNPF